MDLKKVNCIHCPTMLIPTLQNVYKQYFNQCKSFKIKIAQNMQEDVKEAHEQDIVIEKIYNEAHRGIWENLKAIQRKYYFPHMKHTGFTKSLCDVSCTIHLT